MQSKESRAQAKRRTRHASRNLGERAGALVDSVIGVFAPTTALRNKRARAMNRLAGNFEATGLTRRGLKGGTVRGGSPDEDIVHDRDALVRISRHQFYNQPIARGLIKNDVMAVVGGGIRLKPNPDWRALGIDKETAIEWARTVKREFNGHFESPECDAERKNTLYDLQSMAFLQAWLNGDSVTLLPGLSQRRRTAYRTGIQLIESDRLCDPTDRDKPDNTVGGITFSRTGEPLTYYVARFHPGNVRLQKRDRKWRAIPARDRRTGRINVIHFFDQERSEQSRGYPFLAPVLGILKKLGDYTDAELEATVVSSLLTVFLKSDDAETIEQLRTNAVNADRKDDEKVELEPGAVIPIGLDEEIETVNPGRPNQNFDPFIAACVRQIAAATGQPYEILMKHFTASYSASRGAFLEAWRRWKILRTKFNQSWNQVVYATWLDEAVASGQIAAPGYFEGIRRRRAWQRALWYGAAPGQIDETKQIQAARDRIDARLSTHDAESLELTGVPWEEVVDTLGDEMHALRDADLVAEPVAPALPDQLPQDALEQLET